LEGIGRDVDEVVAAATIIFIINAVDEVIRRIGADAVYRL
jgi:hypothetical protein